MIKKKKKNSNPLPKRCFPARCRDSTVPIFLPRKQIFKDEIVETNNGFCGPGCLGISQTMNAKSLLITKPKYAKQTGPLCRVAYVTTV